MAQGVLDLGCTEMGVGGTQSFEGLGRSCRGKEEGSTAWQHFGIPATCEEDAEGLALIQSMRAWM